MHFKNPLNLKLRCSYNSYFYRKGLILFPKASMLASHRAISLLKMLLNPDPFKRPSASEALENDFFSTEIKIHNANDENIEPALDSNKFHLDSMRKNFSKIRTNSINMTSINNLHKRVKSSDRNDSGGFTAGAYSINSTTYKTYLPSITVSYVG